MELLGLPLSTLLTTFAAFGAVVTGLYLLKQRRRRVQVPYLALWQSLLGDQHSNALFSRLKRIASLLLALLIVALLIASLGNPRVRSKREGRALVVLIDAGETMGTEDGSQTRLEQAQQRARDLIAGLDPEDRALVGQLDQAAVPLSPLTDERAALLTAIDRAQLTHLETNLEEGARFARDVLRGERHAELVVISDGITHGEAQTRALFQAQGTPKLRYIRVGSPQVDNIGLSAFAARRYPLDRTQIEVLVRAHNQSGRVVRAELSLEADGLEIHREPLLLPADRETQVVLSNLAGADRALTARLRSDAIDDAWPLDDVAVARVPERRRLRILLVTAGNRYLEAALLLDEYLRVHVAAPGEVVNPRDFDAALFDGMLPREAPGIPALYLLPQAVSPPGASPLSLRDDFEERPFVGRIEPDHPLTRFAALSDINIRAARRVALHPADRAVVRSEKGTPLLVTGQREGHPFVALTFDPRTSDLPMRVAWPLLVINALDTLTGQSPAYVESHRVGETVQMPFPALPEGATVALRSPDGTVHSLTPSASTASFTPTLAGLYRLEGPGLERTLAVQRARGDTPSLASREALAGVQGEDVPPSAAPRRRRLWPWLLLVALGLSTLEWLSFHRRVTV